MNYSFDQDVSDLRDFYKNMAWGNSHVVTLALTNPTIAQAIPSSGTVDIERKVKFNQNYLIKIIPVLQCLIWENFVKEIEANDHPKYLIHFPISKKWYNSEIREISCIRNCIVHNNGVIDQDYIDDSPTKKYPIGHQISLTEPEIEEFFKKFETAFKAITS